MFSGQGKEEFDDFAKTVNEIIPAEQRVPDTAFSEGCKPVFSAGWAFGYSNTMTALGSTPQGLAMIKILAAGCVRWTLFEMSSLVVYASCLSSRVKVAKVHV